ncbi:IS4 family transposase [Longimicrobium terrae]|uniref:IS4 family transposase n=1 Tax=Longimicrobium terrae TaxID=1639882 RepID=UPI001474A119|nr:IS4 family transposase [Longimicrobium terrae]NNC33191.1 IS4 family transposase [Longimicrobium terrae]
MKRMRTAEPWLRALTERTFAENWRGASPELSGGRRLKIADATHVRVSGSSGTDWRLHYVLSLPTLACDFAEVTDAGGGETYSRVPVQPGDVILGDRGYCHREGVAHVRDHGGDVVVRLNASSFPLLDEHGGRLDLLATMRTLHEHEAGSWPVRFQAHGREYAARLCAVRKSASAARAAKERMQKAARKKGHTPRKETLELAEYIFVLATPGLDDLAAADVLELYRARWQIELGFKRLKSLFDAGNAPNRDPDAVRSWIYAKLLAVLLMERMGEESRLFSPWGFPLGGRQPLEGVQGGVRRVPERGSLPSLPSELLRRGRELSRRLRERPRKRALQLTGLSLLSRIS